MFIFIFIKVVYLSGMDKFLGAKRNRKIALSDPQSLSAYRSSEHLFRFNVHQKYFAVYRKSAGTTKNNNARRGNSNKKNTNNNRRNRNSNRSKAAGNQTLRNNISRPKQSNSGRVLNKTDAPIGAHGNETFHHLRKL